ncbi:MAG TPA: LolA-related protein [Steroidobacteraceae bacterium]|nr:LolA-related protein [Steroidobacteraceae bacterium]HVC02628.1 LolA-related protein [Steroidobacteraceae bacterium]
MTRKRAPFALLALLVLLALLALLAPAPSLRALGVAAPDGDFARIMRLLREHPHRRARFTERQHLAVLDRPLEVTGELLYDAPDRLEERLLRPRRESVLVDGDRLTVTRGKHRRVLDLTRYPPIATLIESIRATLAGDAAALSRSFTVDFSGDVARWTLRLTPRPAALARRVALIRIDGARGALLRVEIRETDGDRSSMRIEDEAR